ncbi:MAG TPA: anti-sigma factor antagonist [Gammaproteobacteria bacterium]|nr:anti-sigma factor antagonist [Gammaproteobacteria bacterium]
MAVTTQTSSDGKTITIKIDGRFDFTNQKEFREAYKNQCDPGLLFQVELFATEYMDSSALGMLLLLKEHADNFNSKVVLKKPSEGIKKILDMANFSQQFDIQ